MKTLRMAAVIFIAVVLTPSVSRGACEPDVTLALNYDLMLTSAGSFAMTGASRPDSAVVSVLNRDANNLVYITSLVDYTKGTKTGCGTAGAGDIQHLPFTLNSTFECSSVTLASGAHGDDLIDATTLATQCGAAITNCDFRIVVHVNSNGSRTIAPLVEVDMYWSTGETAHVVLRERTCG